jgi:predicted DNA-binding transcriptional regulator YafY
MCSGWWKPKRLPHNRRMRRADRLFQIVQLLRRRRTVTTAAHLARKLEVSERTVYRDIRDLILAGTPIDGEAGVGYRLRPGYDLPPLMFDREEIQALVLGARIVRRFGDPALARASDSILNKVAAVLPKDLEPLLTDTPLFVPTTIGGSRSADGLAVAREALVAQRRIHMRYDNGRGQITERNVRPLGLFFWGRTWTLAAWCELRVGFRNFRLDRVASATVLDRFENEPGRTLRDLLSQYGPEAVRLLD